MSAMGWETDSPLQIGKSRKQTLVPGIERAARGGHRCQARQFYLQAQFAPPQKKDQAKAAACKASSKSAAKFFADPLETRFRTPKSLPVDGLPGVGIVWEAFSWARLSYPC